MPIEPYITDKYEIRHDKKTGLEYVILRSEGLNEIARIYQEKYGILIAAKFFYLGDNQSIGNFVVEKLDSLEEGGELGLFCVLHDFDDSVYHVVPLIVKKSISKESSVVVLFESDLLNLEECGLANKFVTNYGVMQKDSNSCGIFAISTLKHCLMDEAFMAKVSSREKEDLELNWMGLTQDSAYFEQFLDEEKQKFYVQDKKDMPRGESSKSDRVNYKAFYKGHDFLRKILPEEEYKEYLQKLGDKTKALITEIDENRGKNIGFKPQFADSIVGEKKSEILVL